MFRYNLRRAMVVVEGATLRPFVAENTIMIVIGLIVSVFGVGFLCWLLFTLAVYALPFFVGMTTGLAAYHSGAGVIGALVVGFAAGAVTAHGRTTSSRSGLLFSLLPVQYSTLCSTIVVVSNVVNANPPETVCPRSSPPRPTNSSRICKAGRAAWDPPWSSKEAPPRPARPDRDRGLKLIEILRVARAVQERLGGARWIRTIGMDLHTTQRPSA